MNTAGAPRPYVVVGGGPAAAAATSTLAQTGAEVLVVSAEGLPPYDRTTLSKQGLIEGTAPPALWSGGEAWLARVELRLRTRVDALDLHRLTITTDDGHTLPFRRLLLATGAEPRRLDLPGGSGPGVHYLRDAADATALAQGLRRADRVVIVGGGMIGLEVAAAAKALGRPATVVEAGPRVLGRGVPDPVARWLVRVHEQHGVDIRTGVTPVGITRSDGLVTGVRLDEGTWLPAAVVVVGVGVRPRDELARAAGLLVDDGVVVDRSGRTSDSNVFAAGDVVRMRGPGAGRGVRLEAYQPAGHQGEVAARAMCGYADTLSEVPWVWSDQYDTTLQSVGIAPPGSDTVTCTGADGVVVLSFHPDPSAGDPAGEDRLVAACAAGRGPAITRPVRAARLVIAGGGMIERQAVEAARDDLPRLVGLLRSAARSSRGPSPAPAP